jgi:hypothetical protein
MTEERDGGREASRQLREEPILTYGKVAPARPSSAPRYRHTGGATRQTSAVRRSIGRSATRRFSIDGCTARSTSAPTQSQNLERAATV